MKLQFVYIRCSLPCYVVRVYDCPTITSGGSTIEARQAVRPGIYVCLYYHSPGLFSNKFKYRPSLDDSLSHPFSPRNTMHFIMMIC
jgi:hypothetical protein